MTLLVGIAAFFVILAILILVHELGHFAFAKLFGVRVEEFGLGFPPRLKSWRRGGTLYSLNAIPLGGFVRMLGENGEDGQPDSFGAKPPWQRLTILASGPSMNLLLALSIFFLTYMAGSPRELAVIVAVAPHSPAAAASLRAGDKIVAVDGAPIQDAVDLENAIGAHLGARVSLRVQRGHATFQRTLVPRAHPPRHQGPMGIVLGKTAEVSYPPGQALRLAVNDVGTMVTAVPGTLAGLVHGPGQLAGPIGIAQRTTSVVQNEPSLGPGVLFQWMAFLSANLGVLNLLPVPALDGGRIVFVLVSWVRRRNLDPQLEGMIHALGMAVLLLLILLISYQDLVRWVGGGS